MRVGEAARHGAEVVEMVDYLRDTLGSIDATITEMTARRHDLALRLAVIEAADSAVVRDADAHYEERLAAGTFDVEDAATLLAEAHRRFTK